MFPHSVGLKKRLSSFVRTRWFVVMLNDALAIYLITRAALRLAQRGTTLNPSFLDVLLVVSLVTSIFTGHIFALKVDTVRQIRLRTVNRPGHFRALFSSAGLVTLSFGASAAAAFFVAWIAVWEHSARSQYLRFINRTQSAAATAPTPSSATLFVNVACFHLTELLKLGVLIHYIQLAEQAQAAIRSFRDDMSVIADKGVVTAKELKGLSSELGGIFKAIRQIDFCFSFLALLWYAELMLAIVSSVHIGLRYSVS